MTQSASGQEPQPVKLVLAFARKDVLPHLAVELARARHPPRLVHARVVRRAAPRPFVRSEEKVEVPTRSQLFIKRWLAFSMHRRSTAKSMSSADGGGQPPLPISLLIWRSATRSLAAGTPLRVGVVLATCGNCNAYLQ